MKIKELINVLERFNGESDIKVINTNYGSPQEYELDDKIIMTNDSDALLVISPNSQTGYYDTDRTNAVLYI